MTLSLAEIVWTEDKFVLRGTSTCIKGHIAPIGPLSTVTTTLDSPLHDIIAAAKTHTKHAPNAYERITVASDLHPQEYDSAVTTCFAFRLYHIHDHNFQKETP